MLKNGKIRNMRQELFSYDYFVEELKRLNKQQSQKAECLI